MISEVKLIHKTPENTAEYLFFMPSPSEKLSVSSVKSTAKGKNESVLASTRTRLAQIIAAVGVDNLPPYDEVSKTLGVSAKTIQRWIAKYRKDATTLSAKNLPKRGRKSNFEREWAPLDDIEKSDKVQAVLRRLDDQDREMVEDSKAINKNRSDYVRRELAKNNDLLHVSSGLGDHADDFSDEVKLKLARTQSELAQLTTTPASNPNHPAFYENIQIARYLAYGYDVSDAVLQFGPSTVLPNKTRNYRHRGEDLVNLFDGQVGSKCDWQECPRDFLMALRIAKDLGLAPYDMSQWLTTTFAITYQDAMGIGMDEAEQKGIPLNTLRGFVFQESYPDLFLLAQPVGVANQTKAKNRLQDSGFPLIN